MNELETINLHEHLVRKSVAVLLFKGGIAWLLYFFFDWLLSFWQNNREIISSEFILQEKSLTFFNTDDVYFFLFWTVKLLFGILLLIIVLRWVYEYYIFKTDRIIIRKGIFFSREEILDIENIHEAEVDQGIIGKILDTGVLKLTYGARGIEKIIHLKHIPRPYHVAGHIKNNKKFNKSDED